MNNQADQAIQIAWAHVYPGCITAYYNGFLVFQSQQPDRYERFNFWRAYMECEGFRVKFFQKS